MKVLILISLYFVSLSSYAISHKEFVKLNRESREEILKAYKEFLSEYSKSVDVSSTQKFSFPAFIEAAYAAEANCVYGGWPSKRVNGYCSLPRTNPSFKREVCAQGQMPCQPLLFGRGVCVGANSREERRSAFANCQRKFESMGRDLASVVEYISDPELSQEADELFKLVDEICKNGAQASTPMCRNLKNLVEKTRNNRKAPAPVKALVPKPKLEQALTIAVESANSIEKSVQDLNGKTSCESCEAQKAATVDEPEKKQAQFVPEDVAPVEPSPNTPFPRIDSGYDYAACPYTKSSGDGYEIKSIGNCSTNERVLAGYVFRPGAGHPHMNVQSLYPNGGKPGRFWEMASRNEAFNESYLVMEEFAGGPDTHDLKSFMFIIPRVTVPSVKVEGSNIIATLATGETVTMDKATRAITSGALSEGPMDLNTDRFKRSPPNIHYSGKGISIRLDHRFDHPLTSSQTATVKQGNKKCTIPRASLFDSEGKLLTSSDHALLAVLNKGCKGGFVLP